jgi:magnesium-transporting ATPase (P-type)
MTSKLKINLGVKVFARTTPENKALIVKKLKGDI